MDLSIRPIGNWQFAVGADILSVGLCLFLQPCQELSLDLRFGDQRLERRSIPLSDVRDERCGVRAELGL